MASKSGLVAASSTGGYCGSTSAQASRAAAGAGQSRILPVSFENADCGTARGSESAETVGAPASMRQSV